MRVRKKSTVFMSIVLALALSLTACGDGDDDNGDTGDTIDPGVTSTTLLDMTTTTLP
jgi:hypothetical protein